MNLRSLLASRTRKAVFSIMLVIAVLAASGYAYFASLPPKLGPQVSVLSSPLEFSVGLDKTDFLSGENVIVRMSLRNTSNKTITLTWPDYTLIDDQLVTFDFVILDTNNSQIYRFSQYQVYLPAVKEKTIGPSEQWVNVLVWNQKAKYSDPELVPKGVYSVRALTRQVALGFDSQTSIINLETPTITFTIN